MSQTFNDGVVRLYSVSSPEANAAMPTENLTLKHRVRYQARTVGMNRHFAALQAQVEVSHVLRCLRLRDVSTQDVAILDDGAQYRIEQIQYPSNVEMPCMDLTLERLEEKFEVTGV